MRGRNRSFDGQVVVVTGATSGVGRATALGFADLGADLVLVARSPDALAEAAEECRTKGVRHGVQVEVVPTDMGDPAAVERLVRRVLDRFGRIDVWVNAAAVIIAGPFGAEPFAEVRRLIDTNIAGYVLGSRAALAQFDHQDRGTLVNVGSLLGVTPNPLVPTYVMSKFAIRGLTLSLRHQYKNRPGIGIALVLPGPIDTPAFDRAANHTGHGLRPIPPATAPERVAAAVISAARRPRRHVEVGLLMRGLALLVRVWPRLAEWTVAKWSGALITRPQRATSTPGALFDPPVSGRVDGGWRRGGALRTGLGARAGWFSIRH